MKMERWATITRYKGWMMRGDYEVSDWGNVRSVKTKQPLAMYNNDRGHGYYKVKMMDADGVRRAAYVHRLVAEAFLPTTDEMMEIDHKDGNSRNNSFTNLEWVTHRENMARLRRRRQCSS
jgi:hypothetical protein